MLLVFVILKCPEEIQFIKSWILNSNPVRSNKKIKVFLVFFHQVSSFSIWRSIPEVWYWDCHSSFLIAPSGWAVSQHYLPVESILVKTTVCFVFEHLPLCELIFSYFLKKANWVCLIFINVIVTHLTFIKMFVMCLL